MTNIKTYTFLFIILLYSVTLLSNSADINQGWDAFNKNNRIEARKYFKAATKNSLTKEKAYLSLCFLDLSEGKKEMAFKHFKKFFKISKNPYPYLYALWDSGIIQFPKNGKRSSDVYKFFEGILNDKRANGTMKAFANFQAGLYFESLNKFSKARKAYNSISSVGNWAITGSFDNTSGSGFDKNYKPISMPRNNSVFVNKAKAEVKWFEVKNNFGSGWLLFGDYLIVDNSILFAQTFIHSDSEQEVYINTGYSGSIKIWLNDQLLFSDEDEKYTVLDASTVKTKLHKGYNRILVQIGKSEEKGAAFIMRITDKNFNPLDGLSSTYKYHNYNKKAGDKPEIIKNFAIDYFDKKVKKNPDDVLNYLLLTNAYLENEELNLARENINKLKQIAPENVYFAFQEIRLLLKDDNRTGLVKLIEWLKDTDPDFLGSLIWSFEDYFEKENYVKAEEILNKNFELYGNSLNNYISQVKLLSAKEKFDNLINIVNEGYKKYPNSIYFLKMKFLVEKNAYKNTTGALKILEKFIKKVYNPEMVLYLADEYIEAERVNKGLNLYKELIDKYDGNTTIRIKLSKKYYSMAKYNEVLKWINQTIEIAPYVSSLWEMKGKILEQMKKNSKSIAAFQKAIYFDPNNYDIRKKIRELKGEKDIYSYFDDIDAYELYKNAPDAQKYPDDNSIVIHDEIQRVVYPEGISEEKIITLIKVFNNTGINDWKEYYIDYNYFYQHLVIEKAEVLKPDGSKITAEINGGTIVFTNLQPDDGIYIKYRLENSSYGKLMGHFWDKFFFNAYIPCLHEKYQILTPKGFDFKYKTVNFDLNPKKKEIGDLTLYSWEVNNEEAIRYEYYMPPLVDIGKVLHVSTLPNWNFINSWYSDLVTSKIKDDYEVKQVIKEIFSEGFKNLSDMEKAKRIYNYVVTNIAYSSIPFRQGAYVPQKASKTIRTQLGDCKDVSSLYLTLAKEVGLKANIVLVETRDNGEKDMVIPSIQFNHAIIKVKIDNKDYFIELTNDKYPFNTSDNSLINANILVVSDKNTNSKLEPLDGKNANPNNIIRESHITFDKRNINVDVKSLKTSYYAANMRSNYKDLSRKSMEQGMTTAISSDYSNKVILNNLKFENLDNISDSINYNYSYTVKNEAVNINNMTLLKVPWTDGISSLDFLGNDDRLFPFLFWQYSYVDYFKQTINIDVPTGKRIVEVPESVEFSYKGLKYKLNFTTEGNTIKGKREMYYNTDIFSPEEYPKLKEFFEKVADADGKYVGFK